MDKAVYEPDAFVEQCQTLEYIQDNLQDHNDENEMLGHYHRIWQAFRIKISKEDMKAHDTSLTLAREISDKYGECTDSVDRNKEKIKLTISKSIPAWEESVSTYFEEIRDNPKYLARSDDVDAMIAATDEFVAKTKEFRETADKYQVWQQTLDMPVS